MKTNIVVGLSFVSLPLMCNRFVVVVVVVVIGGPCTNPIDVNFIDAKLAEFFETD